jgi:hypothetical protein
MCSNAHKNINLLFYTGGMNWKQKTEVFQKLIADIRDGTFPYIEMPKPEINWYLYDIAQCREIADMVTGIGIFVDYTVNKVIPKVVIVNKERGRPPTPPTDITKILLVQSYIGFPNRPAEGLGTFFLLLTHQLLELLHSKLSPQHL